jgi:hypothetical protein
MDPRTSHIGMHILNPPAKEFATKTRLNIYLADMWHGKRGSDAASSHAHSTVSLEMPCTIRYIDFRLSMFHFMLNCSVLYYYVLVNK